MGKLYPDRPAVSVIIPCYNVEAYIDRCLASIAVQTIGMENLELICVDDASTDDTWNRLLLWEQLYPEQVILIRQEVNRRQGAARNLGLQYASADWISFVDADDWLESDYFERLYGPTIQFDCDVVCCKYGRDASESLTYYDKSYRQEEGEERYLVADTEEVTKLLIRSRILGEGAPTKLIRRKFLLYFEILFPENLMYEDMYWYTLLHVYAVGVYLIEEKLYHYFLNPRSTVLSKEENYHIDWVTMQARKYSDYNRRGIWEKYRDELEFDALYNASGFIKLIILRYNEPPFSFFQLERELIRKWVPDYRINPYAESFPMIEMCEVFLGALYSPMDKAGFLQMVKEARDYYDRSRKLFTPVSPTHG